MSWKRPRQREAIANVPNRRIVSLNSTLLPQPLLSRQEKKRSKNRPLAERDDKLAERFLGRDSLGGDRDLAGLSCGGGGEIGLEGVHLQMGEMAKKSSPSFDDTL
jgi:hypothetical protein